MIPRCLIDGAYNPKRDGEIKSFLIKCQRERRENLFYGINPFVVMKESNLLVPNHTLICIDNIQNPDVQYFVNQDFLLESNPLYQNNLSLRNANKGVYLPENILEYKLWNVSGWRMFDE